MDNLNHQNCQLMSVLIILKNSWIWRALKLLRRSESPAQIRKCLKTSWWNKRRKQFHNYLPYNIDGTVSYKAVASTRAKLLQRLKDVRPWKKDSRTTWSGYETVQYRNCSGSFTCVITESVSFFQYDKANNVHFTKTGTYKKCSIQEEWYFCDAIKYAAFKSENKAHEFLYGNHSCDTKRA